MQVSIFYYIHLFISIMYAMRGILSDETATVQQKLEAAAVLGEITGMRFTLPVNEKINLKGEQENDKVGN